MNTKIQIRKRFNLTTKIKTRADINVNLKGIHQIRKRKDKINSD